MNISKKLILGILCAGLLATSSWASQKKIGKVCVGGGLGLSAYSTYKYLSVPNKVEKAKITRDAIAAVQKAARKKNGETKSYSYEKFLEAENKWEALKKEDELTKKYAPAGIVGGGMLAFLGLWYMKK